MRLLILAAAVACDALPPLDEHVAAIQSLDVDEVEPMPRPQDVVNRLAEDEPGPLLDREVLLRMAPRTEGPFIAVPKVLGEGGA